jgi:hypothetical protein
MSGILFILSVGIKPLVKKLFDAGDLSVTDIRNADLFCNNFKNYFA